MIDKLYGYGGPKFVQSGTTITFGYDKAYGYVQPIEDYVLETDVNGNRIKATLGWYLEVTCLFEHMDSTDRSNILGVFDMINNAGALGQPFTLYPKFNSSAINPMAIDVWATEYNMEEIDRKQYYEKVTIKFVSAYRYDKNPIRTDILEPPRLATYSGDRILTYDGKYIQLITRS